MAGISVRLDDLTIGDLEDIEQLSGATLQDITEGRMNAAAVAALVFVSERREHPEFTIEDARKVRMVDVGIDANPTKARRAKAT